MRGPPRFPRSPTPADSPDDRCYARIYHDALGYAMLWYVVYVMLCYVCYFMLCHVMLCYAMLCMLCYAML